MKHNLFCWVKAMDVKWSKKSSHILPYFVIYVDRVYCEKNNPN
jgi:hypothetical protein